MASDPTSHIPHPTSQTPPDSSLGPDHRDLYIIVIGIILGILASRAVLGRFAPNLYDRSFVGGQAEQQKLDQAQRIFDSLRERVAGSDATPTATDEFNRQQEPQIIALRAQLEQVRTLHLARLQGMLHAMVIAMLGMMVVESVLDPRARATRARLAMARYVLIAMWLMLALARPALVHDIDPLFAVLVFGAAIFAALFPWATAEPSPRHERHVQPQAHQNSAPNQGPHAPAA